MSVELSGKKIVTVLSLDSAEQFSLESRKVIGLHKFAAQLA